MLFAQHEVILDPPFTRPDWLSCRNPMIYFDAALQKRLLPLFHYSLRPGGALLLGSSETVGRTPSRFLPVDPASHWYWRTAPAGHVDRVGRVGRAGRFPQADTIGRRDHSFPSAFVLLLLASRQPELQGAAPAKRAWLLHRPDRPVVSVFTRAPS